jgi:hypothetical protein
LFDQKGFRRRSDHHTHSGIDGGMRDAADAVVRGQVRKFNRLDAIRLDEIAFERHLVSEHHGPRAIRSSGSDENLQVDRFY